MLSSPLPEIDTPLDIPVSHPSSYVVVLPSFYYHATNHDLGPGFALSESGLVLKHKINQAMPMEMRCCLPMLAAIHIPQRKSRARRALFCPAVFILVDLYPGIKT